MKGALHSVYRQNIVKLSLGQPGKLVAKHRKHKSLFTTLLGGGVSCPPSLSATWIVAVRREAGCCLPVHPHKTPAAVIRPTTVRLAHTHTRHHHAKFCAGESEGKNSGHRQTRLRRSHASVWENRFFDAGCQNKVYTSKAFQIVYWFLGTSIVVTKEYPCSKFLKKCIFFLKFLYNKVLHSRIKSPSFANDSKTICFRISKVLSACRSVSMSQKTPRIEEDGRRLQSSRGGGRILWESEREKVWFRFLFFNGV